MSIKNLTDIFIKIFREDIIILNIKGNETLLSYLKHTSDDYSIFVIGDLMSKFHMSKNKYLLVMLEYKLILINFMFFIVILMI